MKGRYNGCIMNVYSTIPGYNRLANIPRLSKEARQRLNWRTLKASVFTTVRICGALIFLIAMASVYGYALNALGMRAWLVALLENFPGGPATQMYFVWLAMLLIGMFIDSSSAIVITTPILLPFAVGLGFDPVWYGVWLTLAVELGNITPPVGLTLFAVQAVSGAELSSVSRGCFPYWASFFMTMIPITVYPVIVTWLPRTMGYSVG